MSSMPARPRARKNDSATETARVMRVFDMLDDETDQRGMGPGSPSRIPPERLLEIADRIAARTEDPD